MIFKDATYEAFRYEIFELKLQSNKPIIAACELCGKFKVLRRADYRTFCNSCSRVLGGKNKGEKNPMFGKIGKENPVFGLHRSKATKALISKNHADFGGKKHPQWKGGKKIRRARSRAKRDRELGYTLLMPLEEGEVGHHFTDEDIVGIPKRIPEKLSGDKSEKHRVKVLEWLKVNDIRKYKTVLNILGADT